MDERIYIIIARQLSGEASEEDLLELQQWLASDAENKTAYEAMQKLWKETDEVLKEPAFDTDAAWNKVMSKTALNTPKAEHKTNRTIALPGWTKYVIGIAAVLIVAVLVWKPLANDNMVIILAENSNREVLLPDNSRIILQAGSSLEYPKTFENGERHVVLSGEAFFNVTRDETKPFIIDAASASVKVLGTSFNVNCNDSEATVIVATGKVQMTAVKNTSQKVVLTPGKQGVLQNNNLTEKDVDSDNYLYWMTGVLNFDNKPLKNIVNELSKLNKTTIKFAPGVPEAIQNQMITINFDHQPFEEMLTELCMISNCKWNKDNNTYVISVNDK